MAEITVIGITDAGQANLSPEALQAIEHTRLLCGGERHLAFFPGYAGDRFVIRANIAALIERLREAPAPAVVLASGDPCFYGIGPILVDALEPDQVRILPGVGSVQLAFARLGVAWQDATVLSAHGRPLRSILRPALHGRKVVVLTDEHNSPGVIARALLECGSDNARADVFEHLGGEHERHVFGNLRDLRSETFAPLNLLVIRREVCPAPVPLGIPEEAFACRRGMITKAEVRVVTLAMLQLREDSIVWDVGTGCGSVAIEAAAISCRGEVYAIERDPEQQGYLAENRRRFRAGNLIPVSGEAPGVLRGLPAPEAVFIGGSGGQLATIVCHCMKSLGPSGRIVLNLVTLEHLGQVLGIAQSAGWKSAVTQIGAARTTRTAGLTRLAALNPVFVVTLERAA